MKTKKSFKLNLNFLTAFYILSSMVLIIAFSGCGGNNSPITTKVPVYDNANLPEYSSAMKFKSPLESIKWLSDFYESLGTDYSNFYGQLNSIYESGIPLGHIFIIARLAYVTGLQPNDILNITEGGANWNAVMQAFQINGLGGYTNLGDFLRNQKNNNICNAYNCNGGIHK